ncbi:MAG: HAMP domain-containing histidine kinase, partial [Clostridia bacterium]|nr:HAMP domain-containing histidine kinase [Clostridia bacterium]
IFYFISRKLAEIAIKPTENTWTQQKRFIQDASHDLKTPLTVIMANNEILLSHCDETVEEQKKWLESTKNEGEHMKELINQMLDLAKSESLATNINIENVNVSELTESVALQLEPIAYEKNVDIIMQIENDIVLKSNKTEYTRLLYILVDNAIKYAPSETSIIVTLSKTKKQTTLCVNNKGNPIPKEDIKYIFDRFYRSDSARIKGGFGLGLSIAKNIVVALNGEITVNSNDNDGTTFIVKFK